MHKKKCIPGVPAVHHFRFPQPRRFCLIITPEQRDSFHRSSAPLVWISCLLCQRVFVDTQAKYLILSCVTCSPLYRAPMFLAQLSGIIFHSNFLIQFFIYLYLETKPIIVFRGIILHMDIVIAF